VLAPLYLVEEDFQGFATAKQCAYLRRAG